MDAYDLKNEVDNIWRKVVRMPDSTEVVKTYTEVPVYVSVDGDLKKVRAVLNADDKIILEIEK